MNRNRHYNPLIFGAEVYKHGEIPLRVSRAEFDFLMSVYHTCLLFSLKEYDLAKKVRRNGEYENINDLVRN